MAIYHLTTAPVKRRTGRSATAAAAYRAADKVLDERTGEVHDYTKKRGVVDKFILVPQGEKRPTRAALWNMAEGAEKRADARVAREWEIALPHELQPHERKALAGEIARYIVERYGVAADVCIHAPTGKGDDRNYHAHILTTTRKLEGGKLTEKTDFELDNKQTDAKGLPSTIKQLKEIRAAWADMANRQLRRVHAPEIDHRSHKERGLESLPTAHLGPKNTHLERGPRPFRTKKGELNREIKEYNAKIEEKREMEAHFLAIEREAKERERLEQEQAIVQEWTGLTQELEDCYNKRSLMSIEAEITGAQATLDEYEYHHGLLERTFKTEIRQRHKELKGNLASLKDELQEYHRKTARIDEIHARMQEIEPAYRESAHGRAAAKAQTERDRLAREQRERAEAERKAAFEREQEERRKRQAEREQSRPKTQQKDMGRGR